MKVPIKNDHSGIGLICHPLFSLESCVTKETQQEMHLFHKSKWNYLKSIRWDLQTG